MDPCLKHHAYYFFLILLCHLPPNIKIKPTPIGKHIVYHVVIILPHFFPRASDPALPTPHNLALSSMPYKIILLKCYNACPPKGPSIGLPRWLSGKKKSTCQCRRHVFDPWVGKIPWRKKWQSTPVFSPGKPQTSWTKELCWPQSIGSRAVRHS